MSKPNSISADALARVSHDIAAAASEHLCSHNPDLQSRFGDNPIDHWKEHFIDRVAELAESVAAGEPKIFSAHVQWARQAMSSRDLQTDHLDSTLESLKAGIRSIMPDDMSGPVMECLDEAIEIYATESAPTWQSDLDPRLPLDRLALHYIQMVVSGNVWPGMQVVLDALEEGHAVKDLYLRVLIPAQAEVGRLWHLNQISVAEEHLVTSTTQRLMAVIANHAERKSDRGHTVIATSVAGNAHDIGIRTISYLMEFEGWNVIFLGSDMPRSDLPAAVEFYKADLVLLSVALSTQIKSLKQAVHGIREVCGEDVKIMVGGNGLNDSPDLWRDIGANGYAVNAEDALVLSTELLP